MKALPPASHVGFQDESNYHVHLCNSRLVQKIERKILGHIRETPSSQSFSLRRYGPCKAPKPLYYYAMH